MSHASVGKPIGSSNVPLVQEAIAPFALLINIAPGVAIAVDVIDRAGRLLGIVYGENAQLQQLTPADAAAPNESLEVTGFNMVYDPVADDWNRLREGAAIGQVLVDLADRAGRLVGIVYGEADQLQQSAPADAHANPADALEVGSFPHVYDPVADDWNRWREGAAIGQALVDPADRAARLLGVVYGDLAQLQQIAALGDALVPANTLESTGLLYVYNGATWDRVHEGAVAGSILTDPADRAGRLVGIVYGSLAQIQQLAALGDGVTPSNTLESTGMLYVYNGATWDMVREGSVAGSMMVEDTGVNTNPERWLNDNHWDSGNEIVLVAAAAVNLGAAVGAGVIRRIREITVRNAAQVNTVITVSDAGGNRFSFGVPAQQTVTWSSQDGREFAAASQPQIESSAAAGAPDQTFISASGVEA